MRCLALIDTAAGHLDPGALGARQPGPGVRPLRSAIDRGHHGPARVEGHGPHRYTFRLFALAAPVDTPRPDRARPLALLPAVPAPVLARARARLTGVYQR